MDSTPVPTYHDIDLWFEVLNSPFYQAMSKRLFELFCVTRSTKDDPAMILDAQVTACAYLLSLQETRAEAKSANDQVGTAVANRLILILKNMFDALAWRVLGYDRLMLQQMSEHSHTGYLDDTVRDDLTWAKLISDHEGAIVLVNDLTHILRHGDLLIIKDGKYSIVENKHGRATRRNQRAKRQQEKLGELKSFLKMGVRLTNEGRDFLFKAHLTPKSYHSIVAELIDQVKRHPLGYQQHVLSDCLALEAFWLGTQDTPSLQKPPFYNRNHVIRFSNVHILEKPITRVAPYGIFPFDEQTCFELITGEVQIFASLDLDSLQRRYGRFGLALEFPAQFTKEEVDAYTVASMGERKKLLARYDIDVRDGDYVISSSLAHFCPLFIELLHEDTVIEADRQLINLLRSSHIKDTITGIYTGYGDESALWR
jgi:hypothetical protein